MKAVFRHELSSCFTNVTAYVFSAFLLLFAGIYTMVYNLKGAYPNYEYAISSMAFVYIIAIPILTMRTLADERRQKTDQLLYSLPLSMANVILGKYAALLVVLLVPTALLCVYPLILTAFGEVYLPAALSSVAAFYCLGAALIAIGLFVSSVTENQAVAAGLCFVVMLVNFYLESLSSFVTTSAFASLAAITVIIALVALIIRLMTKHTLTAVLVGAVMECIVAALYMIDSTKFTDLFPKAMEQISLFALFNNFIDGVFDLTSIVYFISIAGLFLFLSVQSMEKRRWSE